MDIPKFTLHDFSLCFAFNDKTPMTLPYPHMCILITKHGDLRDEIALWMLKMFCQTASSTASTGQLLQ